MDKTKTTIVVVGGVAGGASAATRARRCDESAHIVLFEKDEHISFANCGLPYYIGGEIKDRAKLLITTPAQVAQRFGIEVHTQREVTAVDRDRKVVTVLNREIGEVTEQPYDKLILAPGASPIVPPGPRAANVFTLRNLHDTDLLKAALDALSAREGDEPRRAVVVGAGFIGLEMVEQLHHKGFEVRLVEKAQQVLPPLDAELARLVEEELARRGVALHLGDGVAGLTLKDGLATELRLESGLALAADLFILGMGVRPNTQLAEAAGLTLGPSRGVKVDEHMRTSDPDVYAVGDVVEVLHGVAQTPLRVPLAGIANRAGRLAGGHCVGSNPERAPAALGTAIVRVFGVVAACTGLSEAQAARMGAPCAAVYVEGGSHASYYPGAQSLLLKLLFHPETGKLLGAQAVGGEGVDKRVDVVATALHFGGTVRDLAQIDLAYAPPFGSAKDPLHMAAFAACNQLDGLVRFVPPGADLTGAQVVDVREPHELSQGVIPGAVNIPLDQLRDRLEELDPDRPTVVVCRSGKRGYVGARVLSQRGFLRVAVLTGGMVARRLATPTGA
ncbi:FAD-dependent oxidoreductase [Myxococcota bacterium]|nr:FAD-dependent oxidoreductase [Myxococcota bacterium]